MSMFTSYVYIYCILYMYALYCDIVEASCCGEYEYIQFIVEQ